MSAVLRGDLARDPVVIGGGSAGLIAAREARRQGLSPLIPSPRFVVATGSRPAMPPIPGLADA